MVVCVTFKALLHNIVHICITLTKSVTTRYAYVWGNTSQNESETFLTYALPSGFQEKTVHVQRLEYLTVTNLKTGDFHLSC